MTSLGEFGSWTHLVRRFFGALSPAGPRPEDERWALDHLLPGEQALWRRMSGPDRRHAVGVARDVIGLLGAGEQGGDGPGREVVASALLHDVGKVESGLGTIARALVTMAAMLVGRRRLAEAGGSAGGAADGAGRWRQRVADYLNHDRIGAALLREAGADHMTVAWAGEHHRPASDWTVERRLADALKTADGD